MKLIDAARCPFCARVRIVLAEKGIEFERVEVDLSDRPQWLIDLNPPGGLVPVLDDGFTLPESEVIMAYLEERHPEPALLPPDLADRARARLLVQRFQANLGLEAGAEVIAYCHSGSRSALAAQALRAIGYDARNYVGSWHEWSRHDDLPIER